MLQSSQEGEDRRVGGGCAGARVPVTGVGGRVVFPSPALVLPPSRRHLRLLISGQVAAVKTPLIKSDLRQALSFHSRRRCSGSNGSSRPSLFPLFPPANPADTSGNFPTVLHFWTFRACIKNKMSSAGGSQNVDSGIMSLHAKLFLLL